MVGDYFESDVQTLSDGALPRFLKMRKWLVLNAAALTLIGLGQLNYKKLAETLFVPSFELQTLHLLLSIAGLYQAAMLVFVLVQLISTYGPSLERRRGWKNKRPVMLVRDLKKEQAELELNLSQHGFARPSNAEVLPEPYNQVALRIAKIEADMTCPRIFGP